MRVPFLTPATGLAIIATFIRLSVKVDRIQRIGQLTGGHIERSRQHAVHQTRRLLV